MPSRDHSVGSTSAGSPDAMCSRAPRARSPRSRSYPPNGTIIRRVAKQHIARTDQPTSSRRRVSLHSAPKKRTLSHRHVASSAPPSESATPSAPSGAELSHVRLGAPERARIRKRPRRRDPNAAVTPPCGEGGLHVAAVPAGSRRGRPRGAQSSASAGSSRRRARTPRKRAPGCRPAPPWRARAPSAAPRCRAAAARGGTSASTPRRQRRTTRRAWRP